MIRALIRAARYLLPVTLVSKDLVNGSVSVFQVLLVAGEDQELIMLVASEVLFICELPRSIVLYHHPLNYQSPLGSARVIVYELSGPVRKVSSYAILKEFGKNRSFTWHQSRVPPLTS